MWSSRPSSRPSASSRRPCRIRSSARAMAGCQSAWGRVRAMYHAGAHQDALGLLPPTEQAEQAPVDPIAMAADDHGWAGTRTDEPVLAEEGAPGLEALQVGRLVAGREERAHRLGRHRRLVRPAAAGQRHGLVQHRHPFGDTTGFHVGQPAVGERLGLQVDVPEATGPVEGQLRPGPQDVGVGDVTAHGRDGHPTLFEARLFVLDEVDRPAEPATGGEPVGQAVGVHVAQPCTRHGRRAPLAPVREAADGGGEVGDGPVDVPGRDRGVGGEHACGRVGCLHQAVIVARRRTLSPGPPSARRHWPAFLPPGRRRR